MATLWQDVRYAVRSLRRSPGFAVVAVLTLALGIGATTAIFSVVNGVLLDSLPFPDSERLVQLHTLIQGEARDDRNLSPPNFMSIREESRSFEGMAAFIPTDHAVRRGSEGFRSESARVTAGFFDVLQVPPLHGRTFRPEENDPGNERVVLLSHRLWQERFGGDPGLIGEPVTVDGVSHTVVGIMPEGFDFPEGAALWIPQRYNERWSATTTGGRKRNTWIPVLARLRPGVTLEEAQTELRTLGRRLATSFPETNTGVRFSAVPLQQELVGDVRTPLLLLQGAVGLVLLIACANVSGLLVARGTARTNEIAVRGALGARRSRLVRQLATESLVLGTAGGVLGLLLAFWASEGMMVAAPDMLPRPENVRLDGAVATFAFGVTLVASLLTGILPALRTTKHPLAGVLQAGGRSGSESRQSQRLRKGLVAGELALAVVLLVGSGLLLRSFAQLTSVDPGFRTEHVLSFPVELPEASYESDTEIRLFFDRLVERIENVPSVRTAGAVFQLPLQGTSFRSRFGIEGRPLGPDEPEPSIGVRSVTPDYLTTLGVPVLRGRNLTERDDADSPPVAVINQAAADRFFPNENPIGRRLVNFSYDAIEDRVEGFTIVGIVGNMRHQGLASSPEPEVFFPHAQVPLPDMTMIVRTAREPAGVTGALRREVQDFAPGLPVPEFSTLDRLVAESVAQPRFLTGLLSIFAAVALALAAVGVFGLVRFTVSRETREIGIRIALGARPRQVLLNVLSESARLTAFGIATGVVGALTLTRVLQDVLYEVEPTDPAAFTGAVLVLATVGLTAGYLPARRAAQLDPMIALQNK